MSALPKDIQSLEQNIFVDENGEVYKLPEMSIVQTCTPKVPDGVKSGNFHPLCCFVKSAHYQNGYNKTEIADFLANLNSTTAIEWTKLRVDYEYFLFVQYGQNRQEVHKHAVNDLLEITCQVWEWMKLRLTLMFASDSALQMLHSLASNSD